MSEFEEFYRELELLADEHGLVTVDQLIRKVQEDGFLINNLFQLHEDRWRCSLRKEPDFYEYGEGDSPEVALLNALYNANVVLNYSHMVARKKLRR